LSSQLVFKKTLFSLQGLGGKNGREGKCIQVPSPLQVSCSNEKPHFSARWQMLKCTQGNCILLTWLSSKAFPSLDIALQKNLYFPWNVIETKLYKRKFKSFSAEKSLCTQNPLHRTCWREVLPTRVMGSSPIP
jgi:hypothetical protein